jgi:hypothetical protein
MKNYASKEDTQMFAAAEERQKIKCKVNKMLNICIAEKRQKNDASKMKKILNVCSCRGETKE